MVPLGDRPERDGYVPDSLSAKDRHVFSLLHRILGRVLPEDENDVDGDKDYQLDRARVLEAGLTQEYWVESAGIANELSKRDSQRVMDILDMFRIAGFGVTELQKQGISVPSELTSTLRYQGFDFNDELEGKMGSYVEYLVNKGRWQEHAGFINSHDGGNSHACILVAYMRMLAEYRRIRERRRPEWAAAATPSPSKSCKRSRASGSTRTAADDRAHLVEGRLEVSTLFVDESKSRAYTMVATVVVPGDQTALPVSQHQQCVECSSQRRTQQCFVC